MLLLYKNSLTYGFCEQTTNVTVHLPPRAGVYNSKQDYCYLTVKIIVLGLLRTKLGLWLFIRVKCRSGGGGQMSALVIFAIQCLAGLRFNLAGPVFTLFSQIEPDFRPDQQCRSNIHCKLRRNVTENGKICTYSKQKKMQNHKICNYAKLHI